MGEKQHTYRIPVREKYNPRSRPRRAFDVIEWDGTQACADAIVDLLGAQAHTERRLNDENAEVRVFALNGYLRRGQWRSLRDAERGLLVYRFPGSSLPQVGRPGRFWSAYDRTDLPPG